MADICENGCGRKPFDGMPESCGSFEIDLSNVKAICSVPGIPGYSLPEAEGTGFPVIDTPVSPEDCGCMQITNETSDIDYGDAKYGSRGSKKLKVRLSQVGDCCDRSLKLKVSGGLKCPLASLDVNDGVVKEPVDDYTDGSGHRVDGVIKMDVQKSDTECSMSITPTAYIPNTAAAILSVGGSGINERGFMSAQAFDPKTGRDMGVVEFMPLDVCGQGGATAFFGVDMRSRRFIGIPVTVLRG